MPATTPSLSPGLELLGRFDGSGAKEPRYLIRRPDGKMVLVSHILYALVCAMSTSSAPDELARVVGTKLGRPMGPEGVEYLVEHKLSPIGLLDDQQTSSNAEPVLSLATGRAILPHSLVKSVARFLSVAFHPAVMTATLISALTLFVWLWAVGGLNPQIYDLQQPGSVLTVLALTMAGALFHEIGHAAAAIYGGATPGRVGIGVHIVWPAFYTDLTDSYRLNRAGRVRTDLGGVYFNIAFTLLLAGANSLTGNPVFLAAVVIQYLLVTIQFIPFLRLDGYYILSDLSGVPDLSTMLRSTRRGIGRGQPTPDVTALRPGIQLFVTYWAIFSMAAGVAILTWLVWRLPLLVPALGDLGSDYAAAAAGAFVDGATLAGSVAAAGLLLVGLQLIGLCILVIRGALRVVSKIIPSKVASA